MSKRKIKITGIFCDQCNSNLTFSNHQNVHIGKKVYDFCSNICQDAFGKKKRWKGYAFPRKELWQRSKRVNGRDI